MIGIGLSLIWLISVSTRPPMPVLGREPGTQAFRELAEHPDDEQVPGVVVMRLDGGLFFATSDALEDRIREVPLTSTGISGIVLDCGGVDFIDSQGSAKLGEIAELTGVAGVSLRLARVKPGVRELLLRDGVVDRIGKEGFIRTRPGGQGTDRSRGWPRRVSSMTCAGCGVAGRRQLSSPWFPLPHLVRMGQDRVQSHHATLPSRCSHTVLDAEGCLLMAAAGEPNAADRMHRRRRLAVRILLRCRPAGHHRRSTRQRVHGHGHHVAAAPVPRRHGDAAHGRLPAHSTERLTKVQDRAHGPRDHPGPDPPLPKSTAALVNRLEPTWSGPVFGSERRRDVAAGRRCGSR